MARLDALNSEAQRTGSDERGPARATDIEVAAAIAVGPLKVAQDDAQGFLKGGDAVGVLGDEGRVNGVTVGLQHNIIVGPRI